MHRRLLLTLVLFWAGLSLARAAEPRSIGYTEPYKLIRFVAGESGVLAELSVKEGDHVTKGEVLGKLDGRVQEADRAIAREELTRLTTRYEKLAALAKTHDAAPEEIERAQSELTIQQLRVHRIDVELENFTLRSPMDGVVEEVKIEVGESVPAPSTHLLTVAQLDKLHLNLPLSVQAARVFKVGQQVSLFFYDTQRVVPGTVEFISRLADPATETVRVKFVIENAAGDLQSGVRCGLAGTAKPSPHADQP